MLRGAAFLGGKDMLRTITVGSCVSVQGSFEGQLDDGRIVVRVGNSLYQGKPVMQKTA